MFYKHGFREKHQYTIFFLICVIVIYLILFIALNQLQYPPTTDEPHYWKTSLRFSDSLIPSLDLLRNYGELNTPLPFIIFGGLEYLFKGGIFSGRFINFIISFCMTCLIGLPKGKVTKKSFLSVCGLLLFPYYLILSGRLYTDIIAAFFVLLGFWFYNRSQHILSSSAFILAIASRQFMLAFPLAIFVVELINYSIIKIRIYRLRKAVNSRQKENNAEVKAIEADYLAKNRIHPIRWLMPLIASLSIIGWLVLFEGIAPEAGMTARAVPAVQQKLWSIDLSGSWFILSCVGLYFVIPEFILFRSKISWSKIITGKNCFLAAFLLFLCIVFPLTEAHGIFIRILRFIPNDFVKNILLYILALLACLRFSRFNIAFFILFIHCGLMMKAYPWDKYILPLLLIFWYLKSRKILDNQNILKLKF
ncbi:hypothetical protein [Calothrix sp. CCY 0018]|uniref:hypothetical protein n=1 Tax=Calothrix sp. CCY 0018 TaxID=3103864 RepID=UPI0039C6275F